MHIQPDKLRVLLVGPAPADAASRGGMATVAALMAAHPDAALRIAVISTYSEGSRWHRLSVGCGGMLRAAWLVLRRRVDVLHVHLAHGGSVVRKALPLAAARLVGVPAVIHAHSYDFGGWYDRLPRVLRGAVRRVLVADRWLVLGERHVGEYGSRLGLRNDRIGVLHNAVRIPDAPTTQTGVKPIHAVALGRLGERKGSYDIVAAVAALPQPVRERLRVTLAGDGEVDELKALVTQAGLSDTVHVAGWIDAAARDELLSTAQVFLLPSRDEGLPMALLEAMAYGLVPVTTLVGSIGEAVSDGSTGLVVSPGRSEQIAAALSSLVTDARLRSRLGAAARARAGDFGIDTWYQRLSTLWTELAIGAGHRSPQLTERL